MTEPRECIEVGIADLTVTLRIEDTLYFWTTDTTPDVRGLHKEIARAMLNHALKKLDSEWETQ